MVNRNTRRVTTIATWLSVSLVLLVLWSVSDRRGHSPSENVTEIPTDEKPSGVFRAGKPKSPGSKYTKALVIPKLKNEDTKWVDENFGPDSEVQSFIYVADDPGAPNHPPQNKGHEVMIYLSYIIDNYDGLADVNLFMHAHRHTWHSPYLMDNDAVQMINLISPERVQREGYMNMRCEWEPGCPGWINPSATEKNENKKEQASIGEAWSELFPRVLLPETLAQPCCAQFALSKERIRALPKSKYIFYRDWLVKTSLSDNMSGRVWEYLWQYVFTGEAVVCPKEHACYCDGYGLCFGGEEEYATWRMKLGDKRHYQEQLKIWKKLDNAIRLAKEDGRHSEAQKMEAPEPGKDKELEDTIMELESWLFGEKIQATQRGTDPANRAKEAGRRWKEGDGF